MNPILEDRWTYTVDPSLFCGSRGSIKAPDIGFAGQPDGIKIGQWEDLKAAISAGQYVRRRLLHLFILTISFFVAWGCVAWVDTLGLNENLTFYMIMAIIFLPDMILTDALLGRCCMSEVSRGVFGLQPVFQSQGYKLEFRTEGTIFYVIGVVTITRSEYQPQQTVTGETGVVVLKEQEIC